MSEPTSRSVPGCDSECFVRHHLCAIREVRRLRKIVDSLVGAPPDKTRYEQLLDSRILDELRIQKLEEANKSLREATHDGVETVPAVWLARANARIAELSTAVLLPREKEETQ